MATPGTTQDITAPTNRPSSASRLADEGLVRTHALRQSLQASYQSISASYNQVRGRHKKELSELNIEAAQKIKPPSKKRYISFGVLCIIADTAGAALITAGWAATVFAGAGLILGSAATLFVTIIMWVGSRILLGKYAKQAEKHRAQLQDRAQDISRDVQLVQQEYKNLLAWLGAARKQFPQLASQGGALISKAGALARKANSIKYSGKALIVAKKAKTWIRRIIKNPIFTRTSEAVPLWNALPWWTIGAYATYVAHKSDWSEAQEYLAQYNQGKASVIDFTDTMHQTRLAVVSNAAEALPHYA